MGLPAAVSKKLAMLQEAVDQSPADAGDFSFAKMDKTGVWVYGSDETEIDAGSEFVVDPGTYTQGFVAWDEGELVDEKMAMAGESPILRSDLPSVGAANWQPQVGVAMKGVGGENVGAQLIYKVSSKGGMKFIKALIAAILAEGKTGSAEICPVIEVSSSHYKHKKFGKIFNPEFKIVDWMEDVPLSAAEPEPKKAEPEPEPEPEPEVKPARRRRRS
jgi:hypothetical protein